jgi:hypothetical protein
MTYEFDAGKDSTCDGLGGMTAMLAAQGLSGVLPPPVGNIMGAVTQGSYAENVTAANFTFSEYGSASVDVKKEGMGGLKAAITGEAGVSLGTQKDENGDFVDTATIFGQLGVSGAVDLAMGGNDQLKMGAAGSVTGRLSVSLSYNQAKDKISAANAQAKVSGTLSLSAPKILSVLPDHIAQPVLAQIHPYITAAASGVLGVSATFSIENLHELAGSIDTYLATPNSVTTDGLIDIVKKHLAQPGNVKKSVVVTVSTTDDLGSIKVGVNSKDVSGEVGVALTKNVTKQLYP